MTRTLDVALASCRELPEPDPDQALLTESLTAAGIESAVLAWDDPDADFGAARATVLRSTWDYPLHAAAFGKWLRRTAEITELWNPLPVLTWNLHKRYLLELEQAGLPVTPTELIAAGSPVSLEQICDLRGWHEVVIKPAISASSLDTIRVDASDPAPGERHLRSLSGRDVLVQQYLPSVEGYGERALIWIDGALTHAVRKNARFTGSSEQVSKRAVEIDPIEARLAERAIGWVRDRLGQRLLYARVDLAPGPEGHPVLMELELLEPSLYLGQSDAALQRFVGAIGRL